MSRSRFDDQIFWRINMKFASLTLALALVAIGAGCSSVERSRSLASPGTPAKTLAMQVCSNCHAADGNSVSPNFPNLAGQQEEYLIAQLNEFRNHRREDPPGFTYMWGISRHLTDDQIKGLAAYFSAQKSVSPGSGNAKLIEEGKRIFESGLPEQNVPPCATCHGDQGMGNGQFPRVAHQHADYSVKQLTVFQKTDQRPDGAAMKVVTHSLSRQNMEAVAAYLQGMPAK
jgi:cytochrome c553